MLVYFDLAEIRYYFRRTLTEVVFVLLNIASHDWLYSISSIDLSI
jgi:hypothetical protein